MRSQITTKRGDAGETVALSGDSYSKAHPIMECVGTLDELRAHTALLRLAIIKEEPGDWEDLSAFLLWVMHAFFTIGAACSDPLNRHPEYHTRHLTRADLERLDAEQQGLEARTPLPGAFIVSATSTTAAQADIACTVARRFERTLARLGEEFPDFKGGEIMAFANRLSDCLYVLARHIEHPDHEVPDYPPPGGAG